jgi:hypothetical protein
LRFLVNTTQDSLIVNLERPFLPMAGGAAVTQVRLGPTSSWLGIVSSSAAKGSFTSTTIYKAA